MVVVRVGERGRMEIYYLLGTKFQFVKMKKFWRSTMVVVAHSMNVLNATELYT